MAYIDQTRKASISAALKRVIPAGWKYSLAVRHHSTLVLTISAAPVDLIAQFKDVSDDTKRRGCLDVNPHHWHERMHEGVIRAVFDDIFASLNEGNHDRSDSMTDYFDVGWYVDVNVGRLDKPFTVTQ